HPAGAGGRGAPGAAGVGGPPPPAHRDADRRAQPPADRPRRPAAPAAGAHRLAAGPPEGPGWTAASTDPGERTLADPGRSAPERAGSGADSLRHLALRPAGTGATGPQAPRLAGGG